ncbi:MAG TPA: prenyltransferase [Anaerolineales bacterium]|nr:prenyltransferase [Anaerolineales bacterium]HNH25408.1 prenyltransferase [Anaerolineales bacterium]HNO93480.1 prenyltransferase [Anaerolineales bacterium]
MNINFAMWRKASWQLIKMDDKKEWDALDVVSKWLIATRSAVTMVTVYSCIIAGILAARDGKFDWLTFIIVTLGLFIAHGTNNILNDYTDFNRGVDRNNYFRTEYGVHPLVQKFWDNKTSIRWFIVSGILATSAGVYALFHTGFSTTTIGLFAFGAVVLLAYTYPFKYWGIGEFMIFLIWGPVLIGGVYFVLSGNWSWDVFVAGIPFGLSVASINIAKHIDKHDPDKEKGVGTFPVRVGEANARRVNQVAIVLIYLVTLYLVLDGYFTPVMLLIFLAYKEALMAIAVMNKPKPAQAPEGWPAWPVWFSGFAFQHNRKFGGLLIVALILDALIHYFAPTLWTGLF